MSSPLLMAPVTAEAAWIKGIEFDVSSLTAVDWTAVSTATVEANGGEVEGTSATWTRNSLTSPLASGAVAEFGSSGLKMVKVELQISFVLADYLTLDANRVPQVAIQYQQDSVSSVGNYASGGMRYSDATSNANGLYAGVSSYSTWDFITGSSVGSSYSSVEDNGLTSAPEVISAVIQPDTSALEWWYRATYGSELPDPQSSDLTLITWGSLLKTNVSTTAPFDVSTDVIAFSCGGAADYMSVTIPQIQIWYRYLTG